MEFRLVVDAATANGHRYDVVVEPEGMSYAFPQAGRVTLTFRGPDAGTVEITHGPDVLIIWRPADTEVWATLPDGSHDQIAGWQSIPFPGLDSGGATLGTPMRTLVETLFYDQPGDQRP